MVGRYSLGGRVSWLEKVSLKMAFESRKWLDFANAERQGVPDPWAEKRKAWDPNDRLCRGINNWWEEDERKDLVGWWCCKRSVRYGGRPVCNTLKVKVASLNCMRHSSGSQWSCLRSSLEENGGRERWFTTTLASARWTRWRRPVCFSAVPYKTEFIWSRRDETSADATEAAVVSSKDKRICLKEQIW